MKPRPERGVGLACSPALSQGLPERLWFDALFSETSSMSKRTQTGSKISDARSLPMSKATWRTVQAKLALSPQQTRIVELILRGRQDKHIAEALNLSVPTVRTYLTRIFVRTDTPDRLGLVLHVFALAQGG